MRVRPFAHIRTNLAAPRPPMSRSASRPSSRSTSLPRATRKSPPAVAASDSIYGAEVDGEVAIKVGDFPLSGVDLRRDRRAR